MFLLRCSPTTEPCFLYVVSGLSIAEEKSDTMLNFAWLLYVSGNISDTYKNLLVLRDYVSMQALT